MYSRSIFKRSCEFHIIYTKHEKKQNYMDIEIALLYYDWRFTKIPPKTYIFSGAPPLCVRRTCFEPLCCPHQSGQTVGIGFHVHTVFQPGTPDDAGRKIRTNSAPTKLEQSYFVIKHIHSYQKLPNRTAYLKILLCLKTTHLNATLKYLLAVATPHVFIHLRLITLQGIFRRMLT